MRRIDCRRALVALLLTAGALQASAQAQLPTIMVLPGESWCVQNGYTKAVGDQTACNYDQALNDPRMLQSITTIEALLKDEGLRTTSFRTACDAAADFAIEEMLMEDEDGNVAEKSELDLIRERATADIYLEVNWSVEKIGPKKQLAYTLVGKDYYTGEDVCSVTGVGQPSISATETVLLREAVVGKMPEMKDRMAAYFAGIIASGRTVSLAIRVSTGSDVNLESPVEGGTLGRVIYKWVLRNAVEHRAQAGRSSGTVANYTVNIPLYDTDGLPMNTEDFAWQLNSYLHADPFGITTRVANQGLGRATLFIQGTE